MALKVRITAKITSEVWQVSCTALREKQPVCFDLAKLTTCSAKTTGFFICSNGLFSHG